MRLIFTISFITFIFFHNCYSQKIIFGFIKDSAGLPLSNVTVKLYQNDKSSKRLIGFDISDTSGEYKINLPISTRFFIIETSAIGYSAQDFFFNRSADNSSLEKTIILTRTINYLDTVNINYSFKVKINQDTTSFNPKNYTLNNEINIEELISRLPGIDIDNTGKIYFNGSPISSVLINGDDLFKNHYQELTQNASPEIIESIDIIKNYQKDKILKESNISNGQVINLKLKKKYSHYSFGHLNGQIDNRNSWLGELFVMHLQNKIKAETRLSYNNIGLSSSNKNDNENELSPTNNDTKSNYISYTPLHYFLNLDEYIAKDIPLIYQTINSSKELNGNFLFKTNNGWDIRTNIALTSDTMYHHQIINYIYPNISITRQSYKHEINKTYKMNISGEKIAEKHSIYFDFEYQHNKENNSLFAQQSFIPPNNQKIKNLNHLTSFNFNYNTRINKQIIWINSFSLNSQIINQKYIIDSSYLFWIFPADLKLYQLYSNYTNALFQTNYRSMLNFNNGKIISQIEFFLQKGSFKLGSNLTAFQNSVETVIPGFINENNIYNVIYGGRYTITRKISRKDNLSLLINNSFKRLNVEELETPYKYNFWLPEYNLSYSHNISQFNKVQLSLNYSKNLSEDYELFSDSIINNSSSLVMGYKQPFLKRNLSVEFRHIVTDLIGKQWISFSFIRLNFAHNNYIQSFSASPFYYQHYFSFYPNSYKEFIISHTSTKLFDKLNMKMDLKFNFFYKNVYTLNNDDLQYTIVNSSNAQITFKTTFKGKINFEISSSINSQVNNIKHPYLLKSSRLVNMQNISLYYVHDKSFYITSNFNSINITSKSFNSYNFLDIAITKKLFKGKLQSNLSVHNLLNIKSFSSTFISPFYTENDTIFLRGRQLLISLKFLIQ